MKFNFLFAVTLSLLSVGSASANTSKLEDASCSLPMDVPIAPSQEEWNSLRNTLSTQLEFCLQSPSYFALYGASLLYSNQIEHALEMLERSLLLDPENGSAQIDYAEALFKNGQLMPALQINEALLARKDLPENLRSFLISRNEVWNELRHQNVSQLTYLYGHNNNLNNATFIDGLDILRDTQTEYRELEDEEKAKAGFYNFVGISTRFYELQEQGTDVITFDLRSRISKLSDYDTDEITLSYEHESEGRSNRKTYKASLEHVQFGDSALYTALEGKIGVYSNSPIMTYVVLDSRYVKFNNNDQLDEFSTSVMPGIAVGSIKNRLGVELEYNYNLSLKQRVGDDRYRLEGRLFWDKSLLGGRFITRLGYSKTQDKEGYSTLLEDNAPRTTHAYTFTSQYFYPLTKQLVVHGSYSYKNQDSNIGLFKTKTESIDLGFTYRF